MANLIITLPDGTVINAKSSKVKTENLVEKPAIIQKTEKDEPVRTIRRTESGIDFEKFNWVTQIEQEIENPEGESFKGWVDVTKADVIKDYAINPETNELELVKPFDRTTQVNLSYSMTLPVTYAGKLLQHELYEIYGATDVDTLALCKVIDEAIEKDVMFVHENFVWRDGYSCYHAIYIPYRDENDRYSLIMMTTTGKAIYQHKMIPVTEDKEAKEIKALPSLINTLIG